MTFNLVTDPWVAVCDKKGNVQTVSMRDVFKHAQYYTDLAGEVKAQDVAVMRFLLAVATTVYMRVNQDGQAYENFNDLTEEQQNKVLLQTWEDLHNSGHFSDVILQYLDAYQARFDLFNSLFPFGQVTRDEFTSVIAKSIDKGNVGRVNYKQMNRMINESNNSVSTWSHANYFDKHKIEVSDFIRWLIAYQAYTGSTDKLKLKGVNAATFAGGCLVITPTYAKGENLFETLMLNLKLHVDKYTKAVQRPIWEMDFKDLVKRRKTRTLPDNLAELYTMPSRLVYINWIGSQPEIYVAGLPKVNYNNGFIEPMTPWHKADGVFHPDVKRIDDLPKSIWQGYGSFTSLDQNTHQLGIAQWLQYLCNQNALPKDYVINLADAGFIKSANAMAQTPEVSYADDFKIDAGVLLSDDGDSHWSHVIIKMIDKTQKIAKAYYGLAMAVCELDGSSEDTAKKVVVKHMTGFYNTIDAPFKGWIEDIKPSDDSSKQTKKWEKTLAKLLEYQTDKLKDTATGKALQGTLTIDENGNVKKNNIFTQISLFWFKANKIMKDGD